MPRQHRRRSVRFSVPIYNIEGLVDFSDDEQTAVKKASRFLGVDVEGGDGSCAYAAFSFSRAFIWLGPDADRSVVIHEAHHIIDEVLTHIGSTRNDPELLAYFTGWFTDKILQIWDKHHE